MPIIKTEEKLAAFGRRMLEQRLYMKREAAICRKMGTLAFRHINASADELRERLLEAFEPMTKQMFTEEEMEAELKRLGF